MQGRPKKQKLHKDKIEDCALKMIETSGIEGLSMRKLAAQLGVEAMSLYNHYPNKKALLRAATERFVRGIEMPDLSGDWRSDIRAQARAFRQATVESPRIAMLLMSGQMFGGSVDLINERALRILNEAGFDLRSSVFLVRLATIHIAGTLFREAGQKMDAAPKDVEAWINGMSPEVFPNLSKATHLVSEPIGEAEFIFGLDLLLSAFELQRSRAGDFENQYVGPI